MGRKEHADVFLERLAAAPDSPSLVVHDGKVPDKARPPYALVRFRFVTPEGTVEPDKVALEEGSRVVNLRAFVYSVAATAAGARAVADRVEGALLNVEPTITGRVCFPIRHEDGQDAELDESTGADVFAAVDVYRLVTLPA